jgi:hypothetical protein
VYNACDLYYCIERMPKNTVWPIAGIIAGALGHSLIGVAGAVMGAISIGGLSYGTRS